MTRNFRELENLSEDELIELLISEDDEAFEYLVQNFSGRLFSITKRYSINREDGKDCVQQTFIKVFQNIKKFEKRSSLWTWMRKILINLLIDRINMSKNITEIPISDLLPMFDKDDCRIEPKWPFSDSIDDLITKEENKKLFFSAINQMPSKYKLILLLHDIDGYTILEISKKIDLNINTVKTRLHRGRSALKKLIEKLFV